jgi:hypothetical protein
MSSLSIVPPAGPEAVRSPSSGRVCQAEGCAKPLTGRQTRACSDRHRAALSRLRQSQALASRDKAIRAHLEAVLRLLDGAS